jgi:MFS transporter, PPP family, 3-phenylpropionic acid transporter
MNLKHSQSLAQAGEGIPEPMQKASDQQRMLMIIRGLYFLFFFGFGIVTAYLNIHYRSLGFSGFQIGWMSSMIPLVGLFAGPLWGLLSDRLGRPRLILSIAALGSGLCILALARVQSFYWMLPLAGLFSLFNSALMPQIDSLNLLVLGLHTDRYGHQRIFGSVGFIISTWVMGWVFKTWGLQWMFPTFFITMALMALGLIFSPSLRFSPSSSAPPRLGKLVIQPGWVVFFVSMFFFGIANNGMNDFLGVYIKEIGGGNDLVGMAFSIGAIAELPIMFYSGKLISRFGTRRLLIASFVAYILRLLLYAFMPAAWWVIPISLLNSVSFGLFLIASVVYINQQVPENLKTTGQSLLRSVGYLSSIVGAPLSGLMFDRLGPSRLFMIYAGLSLVALIIFRFGRQNQDAG